MKRVLVTGATGFIGDHLCRLLLRENISVRAMVRRSLPLKRGVEFYSMPDEPSEEFFDQVVSGCECVVHLAGRAHQMQDSAVDPSAEYDKVNRELTLLLARASLRAGVQTFVFISTVKVMGERPGAYDLKDAPQPSDPYGTSKWRAEQGLQEIFEGESSSRCVCLRLPMVYGPGNKGNMLPLLKAASKRIPLPLGRTRGKRSLIYVENVCDAILKILKSDSPGPGGARSYFLTDTVDLTSGELYAYLCRLNSMKPRALGVPETWMRVAGKTFDSLERMLNIKSPVNSAVISRLFDEYRFSAQRFCEDFEWTPPFSQEEGLRRTVDWYSRATLTGDEPLESME